jgi:hypothetical protein
MLSVPRTARSQPSSIHLRCRSGVTSVSGPLAKTPFAPSNFEVALHCQLDVTGAVVRGGLLVAPGRPWRWPCDLVEEVRRPCAGGAQRTATGR